MNITFLIGNGFDLNFGLKTGYEDFYNYYRQLDSDTDDMILNSIKEDKGYKNWSDLEMGLAKFVNTLDVNQVDDFIKSKVRLEDNLVEYLVRQESKLVFDDDVRVAEAFRKQILNFYQSLNAGWKTEYETVVGKETSAINYQFVTFNYTGVLDRLVRLCKKQYNPFSSHIVKPTTFSDMIKLPLHIHGTLSEDMILGVDSIEQIGKAELRNNEQLLTCFVKTYMNKALGEYRTETFKKMIEASRYIYLYGLSWGESDQTWWKILIEWLRSAPDNRLILCAYVKGYRAGSATKKLWTYNQKKKYFANQGLCDDKVFEEIKDRIQVIINSDLFNIKGIQVKHDELDGELSEKQHKELAGVV